MKTTKRKKAGAVEPFVSHRRIYSPKKENEIRVNLLMASVQKPWKVNIITSCEPCHFLKKIRHKMMCTCWGSNNLVHIKNPQGSIIKENCCLFDYVPKEKETKMGLRKVGEVYSHIG